MRLSASLKQFLLIALNNLRLQTNSITSQTKLHVNCIRRFGQLAEAVSSGFLSLDDLGNISILLDKDNDLEEIITHLFNEVRIFIFKFEKNTTNQALNIFKSCTVIWCNFERFQVCFLLKQQYGLVWKHNFLN